MGLAFTDPRALPLNAPAEDPKYQYKKVMIFLTDGDNTQNRLQQHSKRNRCADEARVREC